MIRNLPFPYRPRSLAQWEARVLSPHVAMLIQICREDNTYTVRELAEGSGHSQDWVRKHLKRAGIRLVKSPRPTRQSTLFPPND